MSAVPIITYHAIGQAASPLFTPPEVFEAHLAGWAKAGWHSIRLSDLIGRWQRGDSIPDKTVCLTFDDGYASVYGEGWPRLQHWGFTATVFVISDYCGGTNRWPGQPPGVPTLPLLTWDQVAELGAAGWEIGGHTRSHLPLTLLSAAQVEAELSASQQIIQARSGQTVSSFAYPYGASNPQVETAVRRHYIGAVSVRMGLAHTHGDAYQLPRLDSYYLKPGWIGQIDKLPYHAYFKFRALLRIVRRIGHTDWQPMPIPSELRG